MRNIFRLIFLLFAVSIACVALLPSRAETLLNVNYQGHSYTNATIRYNYYNKSFIIISKDEKIKLSRGELNALDIAITPKQDKSWELAYFITICVLVLIGCALMAFILHKYKKGEIPSTIMLTLLSKH